MRRARNATAAFEAQIAGPAAARRGEAALSGGSGSPVEMRILGIGSGRGVELPGGLSGATLSHRSDR